MNFLHKNKEILTFFLKYEKYIFLIYSKLITKDSEYKNK